MGGISLARFAIASVAVLLLALVALVAFLPESWLGAATAIWVFLLGYVPVTPFALRASIGNTVLRYLYGLTAVPVFAVIFVWMLHRLFTEFPQLDASFARALAHGGKNAGLAHAVLVAGLAAIVFGVWYALIRCLDYGIGRLGARVATTIASALSLAFVSGVSLLAYDAGLIGSEEWRVSRRTYGGAMPNQDWMSVPQLDREFKRWERSWYYPRRVDGRCEGGVESYRVEWKIQREGQHYYFYYGLARDVFQEYDTTLRGRGYSLDSMTVFPGCAGADRYQGTWLRTNVR